MLQKSSFFYVGYQFAIFRVFFTFFAIYIIFSKLSYIIDFI